MTATEKNQDRIAELKTSEVEAPWCDEWEKMVSGMQFCLDKSQLMIDFKYDLKDKWDTLNDDTLLEGETLQTANSRRMSAAKDIFGMMGEKTFIEPGISINWGCNTFVGSGVYINRGVCIYDNTVVKIGDGTTVGHGAMLITATPNPGSRGYEVSQHIPYTKPIVIEPDCWIGPDVIILPGVTVGRGSTVAEGSIVSEDVRPEA